MSDLFLQTAKLIPTNARLHPTAGSAVVYCREDPGASSRLGSLMVVIEILGPTKKAEELIDFMVHTIETNYFEEKEAKSFEEAFEKAIRQLNISLNEKKDLKQWPGKISAVIAALEGSSLILTSTGLAEAYIFRGQKHTSISTGLEEQDAMGSIFSNVARGNVVIGDQIAIVTPALLHQISQTELKSIVGNLTPSSAVAKLAQLIEHQPNTSRTGALIAAVTTPDLMAMSVRTGEPDEVSVSRPATLPNLSPAVGATQKTVAKIGKAGWKGISQTVIPTLHTGARNVISRTRNIKNPLAKPILMAVAGLATMGIIFGLASFTSAQNLSRLQTQYETAYELTNTSRTLQNKVEASDKLSQAKSILDGLAESTQKSALEKRLQSANRPADDPASVKGLLDVIIAMQDKIDNISRLSSTEIHKFNNDKFNKNPRFLEIVGSNIIAVSEFNAELTVMGKDGKVTATNEGKKDIGKITGITPNASEDGLYIMTEQPALWLFKTDDNSLIKQEVSLGSLVKGSSIGSYNGNIYILSDNGIFKHTPTLAGFSIPAPSIKADTTPSIKGSTSLAIDGSIYLGGGSIKVGRYLAGSLTHQAEGLSDSFSKPTHIRIINDSSIYVISNDGSRFAVLTQKDKVLSYERQFSLKNINQLGATAYQDGGFYSLSKGILRKSQVRL